MFHSKMVVAMARYSIVYTGGYARIVTDSWSAVVTPEVAERFKKVAWFAAPVSPKELWLLLELARGKRVPAAARHVIGKVRAFAYGLWYRRRLKRIMCHAGARYIPGANGGYYELPKSSDWQ
jgi:hypothetical protein